ncbi:MAG TPA: baseplate J/gp47 family protein, partial [Ktedonobacteraceae bacterium]|nr:baseplate J/gp47 family protein [Ktedonobacteraceae bacterium]
GTLAAQTLTFTSSVQGTAQATGTSHGNLQAQGLVYFTNKSTSSIDVPNAVVLTTSSGVSFMTQSDTLVPAQTAPTPVMVIAVNPGTSGNVPAGSVTVIPGASFTAIQQANPGITIASGDLSVTNTSPITGGGTGTAPTVSKADVAKETAALDAQLQERIKTFLSKNVQSGDQQGKPVQMETPTVIPPVGAVLSASNLSFTETLALRMTVLVVRSANLQSGAIAEVNATLNKSKELRGFAVVPQQPLQLTLFKNTLSNDGKSLAMNFTASGQIAPMISVDQVRSALAGKPINQAQSFLNTPASGIPSVVSTTVSVSPSFFPWMPLWKSNINVHFKTMHVTPSTKPKK